MTAIKQQQFADGYRDGYLGLYADVYAFLSCGPYTVGWRRGYHRRIERRESS